MTIISAVFSSCGYDFIVTNQAIWFIFNFLIQALLIGICIAEKNDFSKFEIIVSQALPILAITYYYHADSLIYMVPAGIVALHAFFYFLPGYILSLHNISSGTFRIICAIFNTILLFAFLAILLLAFTFGSLGEKTIIRETISPEATYTATIMTSDSGSLGGATNINIENLRSGIHLGFGRFAKIRQVYSGNWNAYQTIDVEWKDDHTLLINGKTFMIND